MNNKNNINLKLWDNIFEMWHEQKVPDIKIRTFEVGVHSPGYPWFSIIKNEQVLFDGNPLNHTPYHLCVSLHQENPEVVAAYKIYSFLRDRSQLKAWDDVLLTPMKKFDKMLNSWFQSSAKYILPNLKDWEANSFEGASLKEWEKMVLQCSQCWKNIYNEWEIIRTPDLMDHDSEEYKKFSSLQNKLYEDREHQKYLHLKKKYEL